MGYYKDNFPGSPAYYQRQRFGRYVVLYSVVTGGLIYMFSNFKHFINKAKDGGFLEDPEWVKEKKEAFVASRGLSQALKHVESTEIIHNQDFTAPKAHRKILRAIGLEYYNYSAFMEQKEEPGSDDGAKEVAAE